MFLVNNSIRRPVTGILRFCTLLCLFHFFIGAKKSDVSGPEIFVGASPCDQSVRPMIAIPVESECELVKWQLSLFKSAENGMPSRFELKYTYGMSKAGTQGFLNDGISRLVQGKWSSQHNAGTLPGQFIIQLQAADMKSLSFAKLNDNLLHLLDSEGKLMIGNAGWSYTLNSIKH